MAKAAKKKGKAAPAARRSRAAPVNKLVVILTLLAMVPFSLPTIIVLLVGMLPTLGAAVSERQGPRYAWICVGGLNFSGLAPWLMTLWFGHHTLDYAFSQITNVNMLLTAYGAATLGWLIYGAMPPIVVTLMSLTSQRRAISLVSTQRKLVEQWGDEVITTAKDDEL